MADLGLEQVPDRGGDVGTAELHHSNARRRGGVDLGEIIIQIR